MDRLWLPRWGGAACAVAGCMPMLAALFGGAAAAAGSQGMGMMASAMGGTAMGATGWVGLLGRLSWPLLIVSVALLVWSFARTAPRARAVAYVGVGLLIVNQLAMTPWLFLPAMALVAAGFVLARGGQPRAARAGAG